MKKSVTSEELSRTAKRVAQSKRFKSLQQRKDYVLNELPECPPLLCLNELANKSKLPYQLLRRLIIEENKKKFTEQEVYEISLDAFKQVHKVSYFLLHRALKSVLRRLPEECVIYLLMQEMSVNHKTKSV